jgi:hypothetical protein
VSELGYVPNRSGEEHCYMDTDLESGDVAEVIEGNIENHQEERNRMMTEIEKMNKMKYPKNNLSASSENTSIL